MSTSGTCASVWNRIVGGCGPPRTRNEAQPFTSRFLSERLSPHDLLRSTYRFAFGSNRRRSNVRRWCCRQGHSIVSRSTRPATQCRWLPDHQVVGLRSLCGNGFKLLGSEIGFERLRSVFGTGKRNPSAGFRSSNPCSFAKPSTAESASRILSRDSYRSIEASPRNIAAARAMSFCAAPSTS